MNKLCFISMAALMLLATGAQADDEQLENGDLRDKLENWKFVRAIEYDGKIEEPEWTRGKGKEPAFVRVTVPWASTSFYVRLEQHDLDLKSEALYRLTFELRGKAEEGPFRVVLAQQRNGKLKSAGLMRNIPVPEKWTAVEILFRTDELNSSPPPRLHLNYAAQKGYVDVRNISLVGPLKGDHPEPGRTGTVTIAEAAAVDAADAAPDGPQPRAWKDAKGRSITGTFKTITDGVVEIDSNGRIIKVPLAKLSKADQDYVQEQQ
ncbi:MAG: SHD1 domain-containing protein [Planctomycetota bacterium]|jgi:hypothetical protein